MGEERRWTPNERHTVRLSALRPPREYSSAEHELAARLEESEAARRGLEARLAELEHEIAELRAGGGGGASDSDTVDRLRKELAAAHDIIRAIESAYIAGEGLDP